ncbi:MAG: hypothetical protein CM1200mP30_06190 [Pseudomonadota bacterium]|nr:MAG: hypothetical protein CM1200mP30_06190 [Pseudomonadota bacterium]
MIVTESGISLNHDSITDLLQNRIARFKHPKQIIFIDELPRNAMGKVQKNVLRESYLGIYNKKTDVEKI